MAHSQHHHHGAYLIENTDISGFSKSVAAGLRVGYVVTSADRAPLLERAIRATTWNTPGVMTAIACLNYKKAEQISLASTCITALNV